MYRVRFYNRSRKQWCLTQPVATLRLAQEDQAHLKSIGIMRSKIVSAAIPAEALDNAKPNVARQM